MKKSATFHHPPKFHTEKGEFQQILSGLTVGLLRQTKKKQYTLAGISMLSISNAITGIKK